MEVMEAMGDTWIRGVRHGRQASSFKGQVLRSSQDFNFHKFVKDRALSLRLAYDLPVVFVFLEGRVGHT